MDCSIENYEEELYYYFQYNALVSIGIEIKKDNYKYSRILFNNKEKSKKFMKYLITYKYDEIRDELIKNNALPINFLIEYIVDKKKFSHIVHYYSFGKREICKEITNYAISSNNHKVIDFILTTRDLKFSYGSYYEDNLLHAYEINNCEAFKKFIIRVDKNKILEYFTKAIKDEKFDFIDVIIELFDGLLHSITPNNGMLIASEFNVNSVEFFIKKGAVNFKEGY